MGGRTRAVRMINSTSNKQIKNLNQLIKKSKARREQRVFVVEGYKMYREVPKEQLVQTYVSESFYGKVEHREMLKDVPVEIVSDRVFESVSDTMTPQGILCMVRQQEYTLEDMLGEERPLLLVLENLQDPGNLGTIFRTAEGAGVTGIIMSSDTVDIYNPKTVRSTMGSLYRMPFLYTKNIDRTMETLKEHGIRTYAAHLQGSREYYLENYIGGTAFLIGNEGNGLTKQLSEQADAYIKISMSGQLESLNAAVAAAVLMFEAKRQRSQ